ncbi:MAG TPA: phosphosulfolactate synthase [Chloroflexota bacterium]|nr:phosphosulfolactate synthase [Chloroflexota bacterium]
MKALEGVFRTPLSGRSAKPRTTGYTMVIDKGTEGAGVLSYPGGTFGEIAVWQDSVTAYLKRVKELGFDGVEVSDGTIEMTDDQRHDFVKRAVDMGFKVVTEVGKKDPNDKVGIPKMHADIKMDLELGAFKVIVEARESGKGVGIFNSAGEPDSQEVENIISGLEDPSVLIWEAPLKNQHIFLIKRFGINVNLGNVPPEEVLVLEALRNGMRGDTLKMAYLGKMK